MTTNLFQNGSYSTAQPPLSVAVTPWDHDRVTPGNPHYFDVTVKNRTTQDAVVQVCLEPSRDQSTWLEDWCRQTEQWLALTPSHSGELTFCLDIPSDITPRSLEFEVVVRSKGTVKADDFRYLYRLQIIAPSTTAKIQDPTFRLTPTSPEHPIIVQSSEPARVEVAINNRSDRVDRFRVDCTGLPEGWKVQAIYPNDDNGLGLVRDPDSVGINPNNQAIVQVLFIPPPLPLAGSYLPTLRIRSDNAPNLGLLGLVYLRVEPLYQLQVQLEAIQAQVYDRAARFMLRFANLGNTPRQIQIQVKDLSQAEQCFYTLGSSELSLSPQSIAQIAVEGQPRSKWKRPWFGAGQNYPFELEFIDRDRQPISPEKIQGFLTWMPRPWWQVVLTTVLLLGAVGTSAGLIWWYLLRPPTPPQIVEFAAEDSRYEEQREDRVRLHWQIEHPEQIQTLQLTGYSPEGKVNSSALVYEFRAGQLPASLQPFCSQSKTVLSCRQVPTDALQSGKYVFELAITPRGRRSTKITQKTSPIEIVAQPPAPTPIVTVLQPRSLIYREAATGTPTPAERTIPMITQAGVQLDWAVTDSNSIQALRLIARDKDGKMVNDRQYKFQERGQIPDELKSACRLDADLICRGIATNITAVGEYRFELEVIPRVPNDSAPKAQPKATELIKIQAQTPQILSFQINNQEAPPKLVIPLQPNQQLTLILNWRVQASTNTQVELSPSPGTVRLVDSMPFKVSPQSNSTIALQVKTPTGQVITRSVTIETYNPNPTDPATIAAAASKAASKSASNAARASQAANPISLPAQSSSQDTFGRDSLAPADQPPQFHREP